LDSGRLLIVDNLVILGPLREGESAPLELYS
jgi:hypothetical protein